MEIFERPREENAHRGLCATIGLRAQREYIYGRKNSPSILVHYINVVRNLSGIFTVKHSCSVGAA